MNRRGFLAALLGGAVLDPERLLWTPGKLISIPKSATILGYESAFFRLGTIITMLGGRFMVTQVGQSLSDVRFTPIGPPVPVMDPPIPLV